MLSNHRTAIAVLFCAALTLESCGPSTHPNQISPFDGQAYDTLITSRAAIVSMRDKVVHKYPQYRHQFNVSALAFNTTERAYSLYRIVPTANEADVAMDVGTLTASIVSLENAIQQDLQVSPVTKAKVRARYHAQSAGLAKQNVSLSQVLTELEVAAGVAQTIPVVAPYASLAAVVIQVTQDAVNALQQSSGTPINLANLAPIPPLGAPRK